MILNDKQDNEGEKGQDVDKAPNQSSNVGVVEEDTDEVAHGYDGKAVVHEVQEQDHHIDFGKDVPNFEDHNEERDGNEKKNGTLDEPGKEMAAGIDTHHLHVLLGGK